MIDFSEIKLGKVVIFNNAPCLITKCEFLRKQQRKPVKKCILKNIVTLNSYEYSYKSGETIEEAELERVPATFMYATNDTLSFMSSTTYETIDLEKSILGDKADYLKQSLEVIVVFFNDKPISVELPIKISFEVIETPDVDKGNTVQGVMKDAKIETGKIVKVPGFIKPGEKVIINTVEDEYTERDTSK